MALSESAIATFIVGMSVVWAIFTAPSNKLKLTSENWRSCLKCILKHAKCYLSCSRKVLKNGLFFLLLSTHLPEIWKLYNCSHTPNKSLASAFQITVVISQIIAGCLGRTAIFKWHYDDMHARGVHTVFYSLCSLQFSWISSCCIFLTSCSCSVEFAAVDFRKLKISKTGLTLYFSHPFFQKTCTVCLLIETSQSQIIISCSIYQLNQQKMLYHMILLKL